MKALITLDKDYENKLKFLNIEKHCFHLEYDDVSFIVECRGNTTTVYKVIKDNVGNYGLELWCEIACRKSTLIRPQGGIKCSQVDKKNFCIVMTAHGVFDGFLEHETDIIIARNTELTRQINALDDIKLSLESQRYLLY